MESSRNVNERVSHNMFRHFKEGAPTCKKNPGLKYLLHKMSTVLSQQNQSVFPLGYLFELTLKYLN